MSVSDVVAFLEDQGIPERYSKEFKGNTNFIINCNTDVVLWGRSLIFFSAKQIVTN